MVVVAAQGFETLTDLRVLDVSNNRLAAMPSLAMMPQLQVWV